MAEIYRKEIVQRIIKNLPETNYCGWSKPNSYGITGSRKVEADFCIKLRYGALYLMLKLSRTKGDFSQTKKQQQNGRAKKSIYHNKKRQTESPCKPIAACPRSNLKAKASTSSIALPNWSLNSLIKQSKYQTPVLHMKASTKIAIVRYEEPLSVF